MGHNFNSSYGRPQPAIPDLQQHQQTATNWHSKPPTGPKRKFSNQSQYQYNLNSDLDMAAQSKGLKLDSRAAELREQLMKRREESTPQPSTSARGDLKPEPDSDPDPDRSFVPYSVPRRISPSPLGADEDDLEALIANISASTRPHSQLSHADHTGQSDKPFKLPDQKPARAAMYIDMSPPSHPSDTSTHHYRQDGQEQVKDSRKDGVVDNTTRPNSSHKPQQPAKTKPPMQSGLPSNFNQNDSMEEGDPSKAPSALAKGKAKKAKKTSISLPENDVAGGEKQRQPSETTPKKGAVQGTASGVNVEDKDLQDWLVYTNWYDIEHRTQFLARRRRLAAIEAERTLLLEEEEASRRGTIPATNGGGGPTLTPTSTVANNDTTSIKLPVGSQNSSEKSLTTTTTTTKREYEEEEGGKTGLPSKYSRLDEGKAPHWNNSKQDKPRQYESYHPTKRSPPRYPRRSLSPHRDNQGYRRDRSPGGYGPDHRDPRSRYGEFNNDGPPRRYDSYRRWDAPPPRNMKSLDLGRKGDTRFFMVKSYNESNVRSSMEDGLWATQLHNAEVFTSSFAQYRNVVLFFSINKSKAFQGYARMATAPSPDTPRPVWMEQVHWKTTPPFRLEWYCTTTTGFHWVHHLVNSFNDNMSVIVGKDGQEIEDECGRLLVDELDRTASMDINDPARKRREHRNEGWVKREEI